MNRAEIVEMSPRDGLQNERVPVPTEAKIALIDRLSAAGFRRIEAASFVSPRRVPQMADGMQVMLGVRRSEGVALAALVPNLPGFEAARAAGADEVAVFASASEAFSQANINCTIAESLSRFDTVMAAAREAGLPVRGYVSCALACPYTGAVEPGAVARLAADLHRLGCREISLGDTIGAGTPEGVRRMLRAVAAEVPAERLAGHFHDTGGRALRNVEAALGEGVRVFDASVGGLGGCPFAPGAPGNVDTLAVHDLLARLGYETGLDRAALAEAGRFARSLVGRN